MEEKHNMTLLRLTDERPDEEIRKAIEAVIEEAEEQWKPMTFEGWYPTTGFGIQELAPYHLSAGTTGWGNSNFWSASIAASNTWEDWMNHTQTDMAYAINTGLFNREATPKITHLRPNPGGEDMPTMNIEQMYTLDIARVFYEKPWTVGPDKSCILRMKADNIGVERIGMLGYVIAKRAFLIKES